MVPDENLGGDQHLATHRQDQTLVLKTIGQLYDAAANPELWPTTLAAVAHLFKTPVAQINLYNVSDSSLSFSVMHGLEYDQESLARYAALSVTDPMSQAAVRSPGKAIRCGQIGTREAMRSSELYREILKPYGIEYRMAATLGEPDGQIFALGFIRGPEGPDFDDDDVDLLSEFTPHLRRAMDLYAILSKNQTGANFALSALDSLSIGIAIVEANASVLFLNKAGEEIIDDHGGLVVRNGHLTAFQGEEADALEQSIRRLTQIDGGGSGGDFVALSRPNGRAPLPATLSPLSRQRGLPLQLESTDGLVIVVFTDPERQLEAPPELLQRLYGLTPGESLLLAALVGGKSLEEAAASMNIAKETARKRLRDVFQKTNTNRQADLVRHVLANPVWITEQAKRPVLSHMPD